MIRAPERSDPFAPLAMHVLVLLLAACLVHAAPARAASPTATYAASAQSDRTAAYVEHLASLINEYRARNGLTPLVLAADLNVLAVEHSAKMADTRRLSHEGFRDRFDRTRARICVENVGVNFPHPEAQLAGWQASPGHHRNLLEPKVARMGIATERKFVTFFACS